MAISVTEAIGLPHLKEHGKIILTYEEYFMFLAIVMDHIHYVFDQVGYIKLDESKTEIKAI
jgi:hypothetical protein